MTLAAKRRKGNQKSSIADKKASNKKEIIWDIYGKRTSDILEEGTGDGTDSDNFHAKLLSATTLAVTLSWILKLVSNLPQERVFPECHPVCKRRCKCSGTVLPE